MKKFLNDFKAFALRGNVVDMAIGIIIGAAFGKIVSSLVNDILMPPLGWMIGGVDFKELSITLPTAAIDAVTGMDAQPVVIAYGNFLQVIFDFIIVAFCIFLLIKGITKLQHKQDETPAAPAAPAPTPEDIELLREIRDLLKKEK